MCIKCFPMTPFLVLLTCERYLHWYENLKRGWTNPLSWAPSRTMASIKPFVWFSTRTCRCRRKDDGLHKIFQGHRVHTYHVSPNISRCIHSNIVLAPVCWLQSGGNIGPSERFYYRYPAGKAKVSSISLRDCPTALGWIKSKQGWCALIFGR